MKNKIEIMNKEDIIMRISWNTDTKGIKSEWVGDKHIKIPRTLYPENITWDNLMRWMETRTVPRTRLGIEDILRRYDLKEYNPYVMCKKNLMDLVCQTIYG